MEMIALQAVKCAAVLRTLCGHRATRLLNPLVEERDGEERRGEERRGEERTHMHTRLVNGLLSLELRAPSSSIGFSFSCSNAVALGSRPPPPPILAPCQVNHSSTAARCSQRAWEQFISLPYSSYFFNIILPGFSAAIAEPIKCREFANYRVNGQEGCVRGEGGHGGALRRPSWRGGGSAAAAVLGSEEENTVLSLIRRPEGLNHCSSSPPSPNYFLSSSFLFFSLLTQAQN